LVVLAAALAVWLSASLVRSDQANAATPQCQGGVPALAFAGLDRYVVAGKKEVFGLRRRAASGGSLASRVRIKMVRRAGTGATFFRGSVRRPRRRMVYIRFGLYQPPAKVYAKYLEVRGYGQFCKRVLKTNVHGKDRVYFDSRCINKAREPNHIYIACGDGNFQLGKLRPWRRWDRKKARARGVAMVNDCIPYCAAGQFHRYRARVRVYKPRYCSYKQRFFYKKIRIRFDGRTVRYGRVCPEPYFKRANPGQRTSRPKNAGLLRE
jgi:hypothetical protein